MRRRILRAAFFAGMLGLSSAPVSAAHPDLYQVVDNIAIYIGLMPAAIVAGHPRSHAETTMHGGVPRGKHRTHLVVAAFDASTTERITDATVYATVVELGGGMRRTPLAQMTIGDVVTYGDYIHLPDEGYYRIKIEIILADSKKKVEAVFTHQHVNE